MHIIVRILIPTSLCVLDFMLPASRPSISEAVPTTYWVDHACIMESVLMKHSFVYSHIWQILLPRNSLLRRAELCIQGRGNYFEVVSVTSKKNVIL